MQCSCSTRRRCVDAQLRNVDDEQKPNDKSRRFPKPTLVDMKSTRYMMASAWATSFVAFGRAKDAGRCPRDKARPARQALNVYPSSPLASTEVHDDPRTPSPSSFFLPKTLGKS